VVSVPWPVVQWQCGGGVALPERPIWEDHYEWISDLVFSGVFAAAGAIGHTDLLDARIRVLLQIRAVTPDEAQLEKERARTRARKLRHGVKGLGATDFATRDKARQELERMGPAILPLLKPLSESKMRRWRRWPATW